MSPDGSSSERWFPPGGVLELAETPGQCVVREVREETGVEVRPLRLTGVYKNMKLGVVSLALLCEPVGGLARPTDEAVSVAWLVPVFSRHEGVSHPTRYVDPRVYVFEVSDGPNAHRAGDGV